VCPTGAIELQEGVAHIRDDLCERCLACVDACPEGAISAVREPILVAEAGTVAAGREITVRQPQSVSTGTVQERWLSSRGAILAFLGQEILPRVVRSLLRAWDRRESATTLSAPSSGSVGMPGDRGDDGHRRRQRRYRGGRD